MYGLRGDGVQCDLTAKYAEASSGLTTTPARPSGPERLAPQPVHLGPAAAIQRAAPTVCQALSTQSCHPPNPLEEGVMVPQGT